MVEVYLPPTHAAAVRHVDTDDVRLLFDVISTDADELLMAVLGPQRELRALVAFDDVTFEHVVADPGPLVMFARHSCATSVVIGHVTVETPVDGQDEINAHRTIGAALGVDGIELDDWLTLPAGSGLP